jgi:ketosteroid isomerase-like protein
LRRSGATGSCSGIAPTKARATPSKPSGGASNDVAGERRVGATSVRVGSAGRHAAARCLAREHLHPDYEYQSDLAGETFRGIAGALAFVTEVRETFEDYTTEIEEIVDAGDQVLVVARQSGRGAESGLHMRWHVHVVWTFDNGNVVRGRAFSSRAYALEAVGLRE